MALSAQTRAFIYAGLTVLAWSTVSTAFKIALRQLSPVQLIYVSMGVATLFLLSVLAIKKELSSMRDLSWLEWGKGILLGVMIFIYYMVLFMAYARLPAQIAQPINNTWGLVLALLASWLLGQKLCLSEFLWMLFAYCGVVILTTGSGANFGPLNPLGLVLIIASTILYALYWIVNTKSGLPPAQGLTICFGTACLLAAAATLIAGESLGFSFIPFLGGAYVGLFELAIPFLLWGLALKLSSSVARISALPFLGPFLALFWINLVLREPIAGTTIIGLVIIVAGTFMQQRIASRNAGANKGKV